MLISIETLHQAFALAIGFALAGALASGYQAFVNRPAGFGLLQDVLDGGVLKVRRLFVLIKAGLAGSKSESPRHDDDEMLQRINFLGINSRFA